MKPSKASNDPIVVLPPPVFSLSSSSNRYRLVLCVKWGDFDRTIEIDQEYGFTGKLVQELNRVLLEGSESHPYFIQDGR